MNVLGTINITEKQMAFEKKPNCTFTCAQVIQMMILFPCRDFGSQIASISLNMLQYNLLSYVKRFESYETIGGLLREITAQTLELSVTGKIYKIRSGM